VNESTSKTQIEVFETIGSAAEDIRGQEQKILGIVGLMGQAEDHQGWVDGVSMILESICNEVDELTSTILEANFRLGEAVGLVRPRKQSGA